MIEHTPGQPPPVERLWQAARYLPQSVRLLGTRYRTLFLAYAQQCSVESSNGKAPPAVADAMAFIEFMFLQNRVGLLPPEQRALHQDQRALRRRFRLRRHGITVSATEKWKICQWLGL
ncbi:MAG: hypothetical protein HY549_01715 [Elusimicrobia bacterium]|nr:hypothetical protein [Elusimicrobiota bacterium]